MRLPRTFGALIATVALFGCAPEAPVEQDAAVAEDLVPGEADLGDADEIVARFQAELDRLWRAAQETDENFPGATAAFALPDGRVFGFATGHDDVEAALDMHPDKRMPSGSIGKTYVAAVALQLAQEGRLDLDQPIATWWQDEEWFGRLPNGADITLRNLLSHTSGLVDHVFDTEEFREWAQSTRGEGQRDAWLRPREALEMALDREPLFPAGEGYDYTDTGYILAGMTMEKATGETYYGLLRALFLEPLGLELTLPADRRDLPNLAQGYAHEASELFGTSLEILEEGVMVIHPLGEWTGGGLVNNPQDLVRWAKALYEGEAIDGEYLADLLKIGFVPDPDKPNDGYGLGVYIRDTEHGPRYGHGGWYPGYNSILGYFPDHRVAVALQINSDASAAGEHAETLAAVVIDALGAAAGG